MKKPKLNIPIRYLGLLFVLLFLFEAEAQQTIDIAIVSDAAQEDNHVFEKALKAEISALLSTQYDLSFTEVYTNGNVEDINNEIANIYAKNQVDVLVGVGVLSSKTISNQKVYRIPSIASIQLLNEDRTNLLSPNTSSEISNYTYIQSPFNIKEGVCFCFF